MTQNSARQISTAKLPSLMPRLQSVELYLRSMALAPSNTMESAI